MTQLPENRKPLSWQDIPFSERPKAHPSTERLEIEKLKERVAELEAALGELLPRLNDWSADNLTDENCRDWFGHVEPPLHRARNALNGKDNE